MKNKLIITILTLSLTVTATTLTSFAETAGGDSKSIQTAEQLKAELAACMEDGQITKAEQKALQAQTTEEATAGLISEKLDAAVELLNGDETAEMKSLPSGITYTMEEYDLGDGCTLRVELKDCAESIGGNMVVTPLATSGSTEMWKDYGNRYFTATATVDCKVGSVSLSLENHYTLSAEGITERPGKAKKTGDSGQISVSCGEPEITDGSAKTPGASDVNMHCLYTVRIYDGKSTDTRKYDLDTSVKYLAHDKTGKRIKVGHAWNLKRIS